MFKGDRQFDLVAHCAAVVGGRVTIDHEPMKVATDLAIDSDFFQYVLRTRPARSVYFSSSAAYPVRLQTDASRHRLGETDVDLNNVSTPDAIYGWVKLTGEQLAHHANEMGAGVYVFRPFSGYGEDQDLDYPWPSFAQRARDKSKDAFTVWGDGRQVRDWVHVDDVVDTVVNALDWDPYTLGPVNVCTGVGTSMNEVVDEFMLQSGHAVPIKHVLDAPVGVQHRVGDPTWSHAKLGRPSVSMVEGVSRALHG
jgi:nucleoside-diphosphate-sugar epimerase